MSNHNWVFLLQRCPCLGGFKGRLKGQPPFGGSLKNTRPMGRLFVGSTPAAAASALSNVTGGSRLFVNGGPSITCSV